MDPISGADVPVAFIAGLVSFVSPCVLPLVPGYLSVVTGVGVEEIEQSDWRRVLGPSLLFIASFSTVFILLGLTATALGGILTLAGIQGEAAHGAFLLAVYSLGLAVPFLITALAFSRATTAFAAIKRHYRAIVGFGGAILIAMGVLILSGGFTELNIWAQELTSELGLNL